MPYKPRLVKTRLFLGRRYGHYMSFELRVGLSSLFFTHPHPDDATPEPWRSVTIHNATDTLQWPAVSASTLRIFWEKQPPHLPGSRDGTYAKEVEERVNILLDIAAEATEAPAVCKSTLVEIADEHVGRAAAAYDRSEHDTSGIEGTDDGDDDDDNNDSVEAICNVEIAHTLLKDSTDAPTSRGASKRAHPTPRGRANATDASSSASATAGSAA
ncbi:hypothetical protein Q5752_005252 [Cryptotrichosporon argae]